MSAKFVESNVENTKYFFVDSEIVISRFENEGVFTYHAWVKIENRNTSPHYISMRIAEVLYGAYSAISTDKTPADYERSEAAEAALIQKCMPELVGARRGTCGSIVETVVEATMRQYIADDVLERLARIEEMSKKSFDKMIEEKIADQHLLTF